MHVTSLFLVPAYGISECELIEKVMNTLGRDMARNRYIISTSNDHALQQQASDDLAQLTSSYRDAKRQYKEAKCKRIWDKR